MNTRPASKERGPTTAGVFLIEAQALFVPALLEVFSEAGLDLCGVSRDADAHVLVAAQPQIVFIDIDFVAQEPVRLIAVLRSLLPKALIYVYTSIASWVSSRAFPGANAVFSKHASRQEIVAGLREGALSKPA